MSSWLLVSADSVKLTAPPSDELSAQFVPVKAPDVPAAPELPPAVTDETGEPYPPAVQFFLPEPVKPPSPPPEPQPAYSDEVRQSSRARSVRFVCSLLTFLRSFRTLWLSWTL